MMNSSTDYSSIALVKLMQQRLFALGRAEQTTAEQKQQLFALIAAIEQAQASGDGCVLSNELNDSLVAADLQQVFPMLIGTVADKHTPLVCFNDFISYRRRYNEMVAIVCFLQHKYQLQAPTDKALSTISWQVGESGHYALSDEQRLAILTAASLPLTLITGGAGTGKTTTLTKALELILLDNPDAVIQLAAPTGKAAQRLNESLQQQLETVHSSVKNTMAELAAKTLHRLLKISEKTGKAYHTMDNPLRCDVLAIDEASMVGGSLFTQLMQALPEQTTLILMGDANQIPAIDTFAFFNEVSRLPVGYTAEFCQLAASTGLTLSEKTSPLANHLCHLTAAKRFAEASVVQRCADAVLANDVNLFINALGKDFHAMPAMKSLCERLLQNYPESKEPLLSVLSERIVLCAKRRGIFGSEAINDFFDDVFRQRLGEGGLWYVGRRILIEQNDYQLGLSNGDVGVCRWDGGWVIDFDGDRSLSVDVLPLNYSLAFALTIHKSQGSEYQQVDIVLDAFSADYDNPLVTKALLYTAITRAKKSLSCYADVALIEAILQIDDEKPSPLTALFFSDFS